MSDEEKARRILCLHMDDKLTDAGTRLVLSITRALAEERAEGRAEERGEFVIEGMPSEGEDEALCCGDASYEAGCKDAIKTIRHKLKLRSADEVRAECGTKDYEDMRKFQMRFIESDHALREERARSEKLVQALEKIHGWHWQHNSPAEIKGWADEALESYRAELETKAPLI